MKIIIIQEAGRHKKNAHFREALSYQRAFSKIGVEAVVWGLNHENYSTPFEEVSKDANALMLLENYDESGWVPDLSRFRDKLKVQLAIDAHCNLNHLVDVCNRNAIDVHFGATHGYLQHFKARGREVHWIPNCYDDTLIYPMDIAPTHDFGFCGNIVNRGDWVSKLQRECGLYTDIFVIGEDMVRAINSYKIAWNHSIGTDINYRCFEVLGCNKLLLTNYVPTMELLFNTGMDLVTYDSMDDLKEKLRFFLDNPGIARDIAQNGYENVKENHTFVSRAKEIKKILDKHG